MPRVALELISRFRVRSEVCATCFGRRLVNCCDHGEIQGFERPRWRPDGGIILQGRDPQGRQCLFRLDGQTGKVTPIVVPADGTGAFQASVSLDGRRLIYRRQGAREHVVVERDLVSGSERELVRRDSLNGVSLSPDGRQFTFIERDDAARTSVLYVMAVDGGPARDLFRMGPGRGPLEQGRLDNFAEWTPDGRRVLFTKIQDRLSTWIVPVSGGAPVQVALDRAGLSAGRVHPDGRRIAITAQGWQKSEVWSLENFQRAPSPAKKLGFSVPRAALWAALGTPHERAAADRPAKESAREEPNGQTGLGPLLTRHHIWRAIAIRAAHAKYGMLVRRCRRRL